MIEDMDETRSFFPPQRVTRRQAQQVYHFCLSVLRREGRMVEGGDEHLSKSAYDANILDQVMHDTCSPHEGRWAKLVDHMLADLESALSTHEHKMSEWAMEWGCFISGGHTFHDRTKGVSAAKRACELAGLRYEPASITCYATGNSV